MYLHYLSGVLTIEIQMGNSNKTFFYNTLKNQIQYFILEQCLTIYNLLLNLCLYLSTS